jgi:hypothetical protein
MVLLAALCPAQSWGAAGPVTRASTTVASAVTAVKPTVSSATKALSVSVKAPELPATPLTAPTPIVSAKAPSAPAVSVHVTVPAVGVTADPSGVSVNATAPAVSVKATTPAVSVSVTTPAVSVKATAPAANGKGAAPAVSVRTTAPAASVKAATPAGTVKASTPSVSVKTSGAAHAGGAVTAPAVAVAGVGVPTVSAATGRESAGSARPLVASRAPAPVGHGGPSASVSGSALSGDPSAPVEDGLATGFGQQTSSDYARPGGGVSPQQRGGGDIARRRLGERETQQLIERLAGCLGTLSRRERLLLELLSGVDVSHALTPDQVAATLHIRSAKLARLERKALARLRTLGRTTSCAGAAQSAPTMELASYTVAAVPGSVEAASEGVKAARYSKAPSGGAASSERHTGHFGLGIIPASDTDSLLLLIAILAATLAILALSVDAVGAGPRNRRWRARWLAGTRQAWRRRRRR